MDEVTYEGIPLGWTDGWVEDLRSPDDIPAENVEVEHEDQ